MAAADRDLWNRRAARLPRSEAVYGVPARPEPAEVPAADGARLALDVYLPRPEPAPTAADAAPRAFPAILAASPYCKRHDALPACGAFRFRECGPVHFYVARGYAVVRLDVRGTGDSGGRWAVMDAAEQQDLATVIQWIADQPWCTGRVGMMGESYFALSQWAAAALQPPPPALRCVVPYGGATDFYSDLCYHGGGILSEGFLTWWHLDTQARSVLDPQHPRPDDPFWTERSPIHRLPQSRVPAYVVNNWQFLGIHLRGMFEGFRAHGGPKKLLVCGPPPARVAAAAGERAMPDSFALLETDALNHELLRWFDYWLKDVPTGIMDDDEPPVRVYDGAGRFVDLDAWPPRDLLWAPLYLSPARSNACPSLNRGSLALKALKEDGGGGAAVELDYPQPGWAFPGPGVAVMGRTGRPHATKQILTFCSPPLAADAAVMGPLRATLFVSCDSPDDHVDLYVKVADQPPASFVARRVQAALDVAPPAAKVSVGWRRVPLSPASPHGGVQQVEVEIWPAAHVFRRGHVVRVEIATGDSGIFDAPFWHHYGVQRGTLRLHCDAEHPSRVELPLRPDSAIRVAPTPALSTPVVAGAAVLLAGAAILARYGAARLSRLSD